MTTNYDSGHNAERRAADYIRGMGFQVMELNWKTSRCEVDIIAKKDNRMYFVEVKSRQNSVHGVGLEYITSRKLQKMAFAAELWVHKNSWDGEYQLAAISVDKEKITFVEDL